MANKDVEDMTEEEFTEHVYGLIEDSFELSTGKNEDSEREFDDAVNNPFEDESDSQ